MATDREAVAVVAEDGRGVAGFAVGVVSVQEFYRRFYRRHGLRAGLAAAPSLLRPSVIRGVWETARYPVLNGSAPRAELLVIAVAARSQSQGIGMRLADEVVRGLRDRGAGQVRVVVGAGNVPANRFYERIGFVHLADIAVHGRRGSRVWTTP
jgi:ribosomal protein S18 acetylase RimI-like enzyme